MSDDVKRIAPAAARNRDAIRDVLGPHLPARGLVLEVASGSGEHVVHFAAACGAEVEFQPSDPDPRARASIDAWVAASGVRNVRPALALDASAAGWPIDHADAVVCINMIHIAPWAAAVGLFAGAARILPPGGKLFMYGPFRQTGHPFAESNRAFDMDLRRRDPAWGVRKLDDVTDLAIASGFTQPVIVPMPANNLSLIFARQPVPRG